MAQGRQVSSSLPSIPSNLPEMGFLRAARSASDGEPAPHRRTMQLPLRGSLEMADFQAEEGLRPAPCVAHPKRHSWAGGLLGLLGLEEPVRPLEMPAEVAQVALVMADSEWAAGGDLSSDSSDDFVDRRRAKPKRVSVQQVEAVQVVEVEQEWGAGFDSSSDEGTSSMARRGDERRRVLAQREEAMAAAASQTFSRRSQVTPLAAPAPSAASRRTELRRASTAQSELSVYSDGLSRRHRSAQLQRTRSFIRRDLMQRCWAALVGWYGGFFAFALLHFADCILRIWSIFCYLQLQLYLPAFALLIPIQVIGMILSIYITFHDADVLLILHNSSGWHWLLVFTAAFVVFGCCQVIQVKRAWSRQLHSPDMGLEDERGQESVYDDRATDASSLADFGAAERITPVALITGVPFMLVHWVSAARYVKQATTGWVVSWWLTTVVLLLTVSLGIVDIDFSVSSYVVKRYQTNPQGSWPLWVQRLFKPLHVLFRITEVWMRLLVLASLITVRYELFNKDDWLLTASVVLDYCIGVSLLVNNSPDQEGALVHIFAGVGLLVSDLGHFIDMPNFALAARRISHRLAVLRLGQLLALLGVYHYVFWNKKEATFGDALHASRWISATAVFYYLMRYSRPIAKVGCDLHTASMDGDLRLLKKLLKPDQNGQVLDVNAAAKDAQGMTPLMLAAAAGRVEVLEELLHNGAKVGSRTVVHEDTALHFAARSRKVEACRLLIRHRADINVRNRKGQKPVELAGSTSFVRCTELIELLTQPLGEDQSFTGQSNSSVGRKRATYYSVKAKPVAGLQLRSLFPNLEKDDTPSPRVLQSVSSLVVSKAAGPLGRRALAREDNSGSVPLGALRRVRELGRGGFGRVIEVELPRDAASSIWRRQQIPQRFALKLQLQQSHRQASSEVLALQRAEHPFIVHLHRAFAFDKYLALLLELCPTDLNRLLCEDLGEGGRHLGLEPARAAKYMGEVMLALAYLHESDIVYRDVKPENILINTCDEAKLTDFGLAKVVTSAERMTMCGTMGFLSPELTGASAVQSMRDDSVYGSDDEEERERFNPFKTDAYSFGVTLQVALLGEDGARRKTVRRKGPMMLPLHLSETENAELLAQLVQAGRLSPEAENLLVEKLLPFAQVRREELKSPEVKNHAFFQKELKCSDVEAFLLNSSRGLSVDA